MTTTVNNPMGELGVIDDSKEGASVYLGKYGAAKGPGAQDVSVDTGDGEIDDSVQIKGADGSEVVSIPYRELFSFYVITGEGKRKPAISFEHKPSQEAKSGKNHKVWMDAQVATQCAEELMGMLKELEASSVK